MSFLPLVDLDDLLSVDWESLVGVDHHTEEPGVSLQESVKFKRSRWHCDRLT